MPWFQKSKITFIYYKDIMLGNKIAAHLPSRTKLNTMMENCLPTHTNKKQLQKQQQNKTKNKNQWQQQNK